MVVAIQKIIEIFSLFQSIKTKKLIEYFVLNKNVSKKRKNVNTPPRCRSCPFFSACLFRRFFHHPDSRKKGLK